MPTTVKERSLEVREAGTNAVITVIQVLSPKNKKRGKGRVAYERKRSRILGSLSNLIEIDLLRGNPPMTMLGLVQPTHYRIVVGKVLSVLEERYGIKKFASQARLDPELCESRPCRLHG